jgi:hypothetical protein
VCVCVCVCVCINLLICDYASYPLPRVVPSPTCVDYVEPEL